MNINITALHFKADQKLEQFITEKVQKLTKIHDGIIGVDATLKVVNNDTSENKFVEIRVKIRGNDAIASKIAKSFEEATDGTVDALRKQLKKIRGKARVPQKHTYQPEKFEGEMDDTIEDL